MADQQASFRPSDVQAGDVVGTLLLLSTEMNGPGRRYWLVRCIKCELERRLRADHLVRYADPICRCSPHTKHGLSNQREFRIWQKMVARCHNPKCDNYRFYGAIGRFVCDGWRSDPAAFIRDMGKAPTLDHSIDRIDTDGSYTCGTCDHCVSISATSNCRWATKDEQARNASNNRYYTHNGQTLILKDWAKIAGIGYLTLHGRLKRGWDFATAIETPKLTDWSRGRRKVAADLPDSKGPTG